MEHTVHDRIGELSAEERELLYFKAEKSLSELRLKQKTEDSSRLVAYVIAKNKFNDDNLKSALRLRLPNYMIPSEIIEVAEFPMLPNGKVDKKRLRRTQRLQNQKIEKLVELPTNDTEKKLLKIWKEVLNVTDIGIFDNFFEIGGDSILSIRVIAKARSAGMTLSANQLFEYQTVSELAAVIMNDEIDIVSEVSDEKFEHIVTLNKRNSRSPLFCLHSGGSHFFYYNLLAKQLEGKRPVYALQASQHEGELKLHDSVHEMAKDFIAEVKRAHPVGPYHFISYCFNTAIGIEIVKILNQNSDEANLIIADTMADYLSLFAPSETTKRASKFIERLKKRPIKTISSFFRGKLMNPLKRKLKTLISTGSEKVIQKLHNNHIKIYKNYKWQAVNSSIQLLLTEERKKPEFNQRIINSWEEIAKKGVEVVPTEGHHDELFLAPTIESTARSIEKCIKHFEKV